jgi:hypothetical protein
MSSKIVVDEIESNAASTAAITLDGNGTGIYKATSIETPILKHASSSSNNIVLNSDGSTTIANFTPPAATSGEIIETLSGICDGRSITVKSGTYTLGDVTQAQGLTTTHTEITGSSISYKPPTGTKQLIYKFVFQFRPATNSGISHFKMQFDGNDIDLTRMTKAGEYVSNAHHHSQMHMVWIFDLNTTTTDISNGKVQTSDWTTNKTLRVMGREYDGSTYHGEVHSNKYWDGGSVAAATTGLVKPHLYIQAIA